MRDAAPRRRVACVLAGKRSMYRVVAYGLACVAALAASSPANTSSLLELADISGAAAHSVVYLGGNGAGALEARSMDGKAVVTETEGAQLLVLSTSMLAAGADAIPVAREDVASVVAGEAPRLPAWMAGHLPEIIRGAMQDDAADAGNEAAPQSAAEPDTGILR